MTSNSDIHPLTCADMPAQSRAAWPVWPLLGVIGLLFLLLCWHNVVVLTHVYRSDGNYSHGFLVPFIALYAAYQRRAELLRVGASSPLLGLPLLAAGTLVILFGRWYEAAFHSIGLGHAFFGGIGLILTVLGLCWTLFGWRRVAVLWFPILYLCFALPLPESFNAAMTLPLQRVAASSAAVILRVMSIPVYREGNVLHLASGSLGVNEACSGIRSIWVLAAVAAALAFFRRLAAWKSVALLVSVPILAMAANLLRVLVSGLFTVWGMPELVEGGPHELLGLITFALSVAGLLAVAQVLSTPPPEGGGANDDGATIAPAAPRSILGQVRTFGFKPESLVVLLLVLAGGNLMAATIERHYRAQQELSAIEDMHVSRRQLADFPEQIGPYRRVGLSDLSEGELEILSPSDRLVAVYACPNDANILLTLMYWYPQRVRAAGRYEFKSPHSPDVCYPESGWTRLRQFDTDTAVPWVPGEAVSIRVFSRPDRMQLLLFWLGHAYVGERPFVPSAALGRLKTLVDSWNNPPTANMRSRYSVSIAMDVSRTPQESRETALDFSRAIAPLLSAYGIGAELTDDGTIAEAMRPASGDTATALLHTQDDATR